MSCDHFASPEVSAKRLIEFWLLETCSMPRTITTLSGKTVANLAAIDVALHLVGQQNVNDVALLGRFF